MMQSTNNIKKQNNKSIYFVMSFICIAITGIFFYLAVIKKSFGGTIYDIAVYVIASILFLLITLYGLRRMLDILAKKKLSSLCNRNVIQRFCFAVISFITLYYYDSASEYGHRLSMDVITVALGIILLSLATKEELMHPICQWSTAIVMVLFLDKGIYKHYEDYRVIVKFTAEKIALCIFVYVIAVAIVQLINREKRGEYTIVGIIYILFSVCILVFANNRTWPVYTAIPLLLLIFRPVGRQTSLEIVTNYAKGIILAFWAMFATAILCRPYYSFEFSRYPGWFSSVASAGLFWIVCYACALSLLLSKWTREKLTLKKRIQTCYFELLTMGAVLTHLFLSMSRTSVLTVTMASIFAFVLVELFYFRDSVMEMGKKVLVLSATLIILFPICYSMIRCLPAMVGMPYRVAGPEWFSDQIEVGEAWDSTKFMNIAQYGETLLEKIVGVEINLSEMAGATSGPAPKEIEADSTSEADQGYGTYEKDGQVFTKKDYTFVNDSEDEESNGRLDIMKAYLSNLNMAGHEISSLEEKDGKFVAYHAHNTYVQIAFDYGIPTGILFVVMTCFAMIASIVYYIRNGKSNGMSLFPALAIFSFAISGMTEWIFHPSIPLGFGYLISFVPLCNKEK